ncbi:hypothetical protein J6590_068611 [Homalodisca vitripennis]|nr:hypothetical protein J6590_068611 [Homalodisca vitripennis]
MSKRGLSINHNRVRAVETTGNQTKSRDLRAIYGLDLPQPALSFMADTLSQCGAVLLMDHICYCNARPQLLQLHTFVPRGHRAGRIWGSEEDASRPGGAPRRQHREEAVSSRPGTSFRTVSGITLTIVRNERSRRLWAKFHFVITNLKIHEDPKKCYQSMVH